MESSVIWKETKTFTDLNDGLEYLLDAGKYADKPYSGRVSGEQDPPYVNAIEGNRNWLNLGGTWSMVSSTARAGCKVELSWMLSGYRKWDTDIYDEMT